MLALFTGAPGFWEILLIMSAMLLLFGKRLPEVGRSLGRGLVEFKRGLKGIEDEVRHIDVEAKAHEVNDAAKKSAAPPPANSETAK